MHGAGSVAIFEQVLAGKLLTAAHDAGNATVME